MKSTLLVVKQYKTIHYLIARYDCHFRLPLISSSIWGRQYFLKPLRWTWWGIDLYRIFGLVWLLDHEFMTRMVASDVCASVTRSVARSPTVSFSSSAVPLNAFSVTKMKFNFRPLHTAQLNISEHILNSKSVGHISDWLCNATCFPQHSYWDWYPWAISS